MHLDTGYVPIDWMLKYIHKYANILAIFNPHKLIRLIIIYLNPWTALCFIE